MESIHSNFVISRNHWPALTVWGDKTNLISQIWSLFYHHTSPQDVHPRIRSNGQSVSQQHLHHIRLMWCWQHTYHSARRGTVCGEWHLTLPLRKGYCSADPIYRNWPTKAMPAAKLLINSLPRRKHAIIVSHNINLIVPLISCVTLLLNLVAQIWKINLKYPGSPQPTHRHSDCETTTNRQKEYRFRLPRAWANNDSPTSSAVAVWKEIFRRTPGGDPNWHSGDPNCDILRTANMSWRAFVVVPGRR